MVFASVKFTVATNITLYIHTRCCFVSYLPCSLHLTAAFNVSLELQGGSCSDQLTLICRHSDNGAAPLWIHNGTLQSGDVLGTAFSGAVYTVLTRTEHTATISGNGTLLALNGYSIQCAYEDLGNLIRSNAVKYSFFPPGQSLHGALSLVMYCTIVELWLCAIYIQ